MLRKKPPPRQEDELTQRLRESVHKHRPWTVQGVLILLALLVIPLVLLAWWMVPRPEPPRLEVIAFDRLGLPGEEVSLHARLEPVEPQETPVDLAGYPLIFQEGSLLPRPGVPQLKTSTGEGGEARIAWTFKEVPEAEYLVHYPGDQKRRSTRDRAHVFFRPAETPLLVIDVQHVLSAESSDGWQKKNILDIAPVAAAGNALREARKTFQPVYLATYPDNALQYRRVRGWVENRILSKEPFPAGPILGRNSYAQEESAARQEVLRHLQERFHGAIIAVVGKGEAAAVCRALGVQALLVGDDEGPKEVSRIASLQELAHHLK
jgi:hypothetical protein